jgi:hypothetical protein
MEIKSIRTSIVDPHRKKADADSGKNFHADTDANSDADAEADKCLY